jgi:glutathione S-transferase
MSDDIFPLTVYGSDLSYFTGKLEMYLRAKNIPYQFKPMNGWRIMPLVEKETGTTQMPAATLADGRWITDTTAIIAWLEGLKPSPPIVPTDPVQRFFCLLLEDYADEWLWRPAMHFRWYTAEAALLQSRHLTDEITAGVPAPRFAKRWFLRRRQRGYTRGDGVTEANRAVVEAIYTDNLKWLEAILQRRPYLLGNSPSLADIAFMGPFFRHFSQDPVAAEIMRQQAPAVWEWVTRMWNNRSEKTAGDWLDGVPEDWNPILDDIGKVYLPYLCDNALAVKAGKKRFQVTAGGATYPNARTSAYRIWCVEQLRAQFDALSPDHQGVVKARLEQHHCWEPLWRIENLDSGVNRNVTLPFACSDKMVG